jgi:hypothetical protein
MILQVYEELHEEVQPLDRLKWVSHSTVPLKSKNLFHDFAGRRRTS